MLNGIDISNHQAGIPQSTVAKADVVVVKATEGTNFQDAYLFDNFNKAVQAGKTAGAYHFYRPGASGKAQADYFINWVQANQLTLDFAVLDFEDKTALDQESEALSFLREVKRRLGIPVWFYCYVSSLKQYGYWSIRPEFKFWLAGYYSTGIHDGFGAPMSVDEYIVFNKIDSSGIDFAGWQYAESGRLLGWGGNLDFNLFYDDLLSEVHNSGVRTAVNPKTATSSEWVYPTEKDWPVSQDFGQSGTQYNLASGGHTGRDIACPEGTKIRSMGAGVVIWADWVGNLPGGPNGWDQRWYLHPVFGGIVVGVDHGDFISFYAHLSKTDMNIGDKVTAGQVIGLSGSTGAATGPHLHWEVLPETFDWQNGYYGRINPTTKLKELQAASGQKASAAVVGEDELDLAITKDDLWQIVTDGVKHVIINDLDGNFRDKFHRSLREPFPRQGGVGGTTSVVTELAYLAANIVSIKKDIAELYKLVRSLQSGGVVSTDGGTIDLEALRRIVREEIDKTKTTTTFGGK